MLNAKIFLPAILLLFFPFLLPAQRLLPYKNPALPAAERVQDLLQRMTIEEKFWQLFMIPGNIDDTLPGQYKNGIFGFQVNAGSKDGNAVQQLLTYSASENALSLARKINGIQHYFVEKTRLGIPVIAFDEALHGLVRDGATAFPQAIALAATFDTALMSRVAHAIATETKMRGIRQILSPVVNIAGDVRWGRTEETYGEDPFLSSEMGVAFVSAFEKMDIITTPKHFVANVGDGGRDSYPIHFNERLLEEIYLPPFRACIERGGSRSVMTAYNSLDGTASSANDWLLNKTLKDKWGFKGFVISDAGATGGTVVLHNTAKDYPESAQQSITGGLDVIFQTAYDHYKLFIPPFLDGGIDMKRIDDAVSRVLLAKFELGLFEQPYVAETAIVKSLATHKALAREAAAKSIVLLKNDKHLLPLSKNLRSIAVIGEDAVAARLGGYSGPGNNKVSILDGIRQKTGENIQVSYVPGPGRETKAWTVVPPKYLHHIENGKTVAGMQGSYFNNISLSGEPALTRTDAAINFSWTLFTPGTAITEQFYSVRWAGTLKAPVSGKYKIGLEGNDGYRLYINGSLIVDNWTKRSYNTLLSDFTFEKDKAYTLRVEFFEPVGNAHIKLVWNAEITTDQDAQIQEAVAAARRSDIAVIVAGIHEGEFQDRAMLSLPGRQEELIQQVAATGKPVVVVLVGGSAVTMRNWLDKVHSVLDVWYPGEEGGHAVADVLFGDYNPAGRLPVTFPVHEAQLPLVYNHKPTGRGDDYNNLSGLPLFPFGYGLSYTTFEYSNPEFSKRTMAPGETTTVKCMIKNTGKADGDEVVQLYITDKLASVARPVMELKGFQRVWLKAGESRQITFTITPEMLSMLNAEMETVVEPGEFTIMIGASSTDIRLKEVLEVK
ncbi:glycoside hydrolase family 3 C-terminal domain-containing protein [Agriterribacter sp.]|uniref:glycoside hydrolase family 3 protein n=1 Tax=Agriterribacter sp. TaxID=2821509 RepID=UPI002BCAAC58|nr:glycoside hydrolase family 3 C-terminal domain-containing protein [Agriterribacter sp.]HRO45400.1 glycoside hydrolase family 3 C-terminal domain-containing protein [Agriterribacter sp.]HRQ16909.1 glycoside hydrolase family 3 C-terminal domain-containing protein [Agriterribacter sp.]